MSAKTKSASTRQIVDRLDGDFKRISERAEAALNGSDPMLALSEIKRIADVAQDSTRIARMGVNQ